MILRYVPKLPKGSITLFFKLLYKKELIEGDYIWEFEKEFARYIGVKYAISFSSARNGLVLLLQQLGIGKSDEVILPSFTCPAVPSAIEHIGAIPVFIDVDSGTFNMDAKLIESKLTRKTKAIIATHIDGQPCDLGSIMKLSSTYKLKVIEDCAQAIGAKYKGVKVGKFGDAAYFSFARGKQINTLGGGMIVTNIDWLADNLKENVKNYSLPPKLPIIKKFILMNFIILSLRPLFFNIFVFPLMYLSSFIKLDPVHILFEDKGGIKKYTRYTNFQAVLGLNQIKLVDIGNIKRQKNARILSSQLSKKIKKQKQTAEVESIFLYYDIVVGRREEVKRKLLNGGIDTQESWNVSCSSLERFKKYNCKCQISDQLEKKSLYLPINEQLDDVSLGYIAKKLNRIMESLDNEK